jgi:DNA-directed RNA polymerase specialized sigma24 family protein
MESAETLEAFLLWLGHNQAAGARKYEEVREKLIVLFRCRGCQMAEELADVTIDRTARVVMKPGFTFEGNPIAYFRGVARNVYLEWVRGQQRFRHESISEVHPDLEAGENNGEAEEIMSFCLGSCLDKLPAQKKMILLRYYHNDRRAKIDERQQLAEEEGIGLNALRIQVFRLRSMVRRCVEQCRIQSEINAVN